MSSAEPDRLLAWDLFPGSAPQGRILSIARAGLGVACLIAELTGRTTGGPMKLAAAGFALYSAVLALRGGAHKRAFGLLTLFLDTVFFLALAEYGADASLWLASLFYAYLLLSAQLLYGLAEMLLVTCVSAVFVFVAHYGRETVFAQAVVVGGVLGIVGALIKQRASVLVDRLSSEAGKSREEARLARETERQRIAADFHDGPLQSFISFQIRLDVLRRILERDLAAGLEELGQLQRLSQAQVKELRSFVRSMRPVDSEASLVAAIRRLVDDFQKETGIAVTFVGGDKPVAVAPEISTDVLQMVREALHNVQKHAHASRVAVAVEQPGKALEISIDDNGAGFPFSGAYSLDELDLLRLGPVSLKRRARAVGADLSIESRPGRGAGLKLTIPL